MQCGGKYARIFPCRKAMVEWRSGSAGALQAQGRGFKSLLDHHRIQKPHQPMGLFSCLHQKSGRQKASRFDVLGVPWRIRISVAGLRSRCPWPLDEGGVPILARPIASTANARVISANGAKAAQTHLRIIIKHPHRQAPSQPNLGPKPKPPAPC